MTSESKEEKYCCFVEFRRAYSDRVPYKTVIYQQERYFNKEV